MLFSFFQEIGVSKDESRVLLDKNPVVASTSLDSLQARVRSFRSIGIDGLMLSQLITKSPSLFTAEEIGLFLQFCLDDLEGKIEPLQLKRLFRTTEARFLVGLDQKVRFLLHCGVPVDKIFDVLNKVNLYKALCLKSLEEIERTILFFARFGGIDLIVMRLMLLNFDLETQLVPRVRFQAELSGGDDESLCWVGYGQIAARFLEKDEVPNFISRIWCEWLGKRTASNGLLKVPDKSQTPG